MKVLIIPALFLLASCATSSPDNLKVVEKLVPVPVKCNEVVKKTSNAVEQAELGQKLEVQNRILRVGLAEQKMYEKDLEAAFVRCGGTIERP